MAGEGEIIRVVIGSVASSLDRIGTRNIAVEVGCTGGVSVAWGKEVKSGDRS